jgi:hypothetical protein
MSQIFYVTRQIEQILKTPLSTILESNIAAFIPPPLDEYHDHGIRN